MVTITPTASIARNPADKKTLVWETITENDTSSGIAWAGGKGTVTMEGTWGGASIELQFSKSGSNYHSIDATNLTFTADKSYNIEIGTGFLKPVNTGGTSSDVDVTIEPIINEETD